MLDLKHNLPGPWQSEAINQVREELREVHPENFTSVQLKTMSANIRIIFSLCKVVNGRCVSPSAPLLLLYLGWIGVPR